MDFKRFEVRKILRYSEQVKDQAEVTKLLKNINEYSVKCLIKVKDIASPMRECCVLEVKGDKVLLFSRSPSKIKTWFQFSDIESVEVECNLDLMVEEDDGGRWARIL